MWVRVREMRECQLCHLTAQTSFIANFKKLFQYYPRSYCALARLILLGILFSEIFAQYFILDPLPSADLAAELNDYYSTGLGQGGLVNFSGEVFDTPEHPHAGELRFHARGKVDNRISGQFLVTTPDVPWNTISSIRSGDTFAGIGRIRPFRLNQTASRGISNFDFALLRQGLIGSVQLTSGVLTKRNTEPSFWSSYWNEILLKLSRRFQLRDSFGVLLAGTLGDFRFVSDEVKHVFRETGTLHVLVVSGYHIGLVFLIVHSMVRRCIRRFMRLVLWMPVEIPAALSGCIVACCYAQFTGNALPTFRAACIGCVYTLSKILGRPTDACSSLLLAAIVVIAFWPSAFLELSFQLTFAALGGLLLSGSLCRRRRPQQSIGFRYWSFRYLGFRFGQFVLTALIVYLCTAAILLLQMQSLAPLSPIFNILLTPALTLVGVLFGFLSLGLAAVSFPGAETILELNLTVLDGLLWILEASNEFVQRESLGIWKGFGYQKVIDSQAQACLWLLISVLVALCVYALCPTADACRSQSDLI